MHKTGCFPPEKSLPFAPCLSCQPWHGAGWVQISALPNQSFYTRGRARSAPLLVNQKANIDPGPAPRRHFSSLGKLRRGQRWMHGPGGHCRLQILGYFGFYPPWGQRGRGRTGAAAPNLRPSPHPGHPRTWGWPRGHPNVVDFPSAASPGREIARPCFSHQAPSHFPARSSGPCIESFPLPQGKTKASEAESGTACAERLGHGPATTGVAFWGCF